MTSSSPSATAPVAVVTLNRPDALNALSDELMEQLVVDAAGLDRDEEVRCIVLGGSDKAFAAGADIGELARSSAIDLYYQRRIERWDAIRGLWTPLVAAVSGYCLGGGCELALACDLIVASESAQVRPAGDGRRRDPGRGRHAAADAGGRQGARDGRDPERAVPLGATRRSPQALVARVVAGRRMARRGEARRPGDRRRRRRSRPGWRRRASTARTRGRSSSASSTSGGCSTWRSPRRTRRKA